MDDIDYKAQTTVQKIEQYERNWHIFKAVLLGIGVVVIIIIQFYTFNQLLSNSNANRKSVASNHQLVCDIVKQVKITNQQINNECR